MKQNVFYLEDGSSPSGPEEHRLELLYIFLAQRTMTGVEAESSAASLVQRNLCRYYAYSLVQETLRVVEAEVSPALITGGAYVGDPHTLRCTDL